MERRMVDQQERMAKEFQEEVRRRQEQEERKQEQEAKELGSQEPKKSTTLVPNSPPVPALRDRIKKEEEDLREKEEKKVMETETISEVKTHRRDTGRATPESRGQEEQTLDVVGKLDWTD